MKNYIVKVNGVAYDVEIEEKNPENAGSSAVNSPIQKEQKRQEPARQEPAATPVSGGKPLSAPMPGKVLSISCSVGSEVAAGDVLIVLEAMKMENEISAEIGGKVLSINVSEGEMVEGGATLLVIA